MAITVLSQFFLDVPEPSRPLLLLKASLTFVSALGELSRVGWPCGDA